MFYVKCIRQAHTQNANTSPYWLVFVFCVRMTQYAVRLPDLENGENGENEENETRANICKTARRYQHNRKESIILLLVSKMSPQRLQLTIVSYIIRPPRPNTRRSDYIRYYRRFGGNESERALPPAIRPREERKEGFSKFQKSQHSHKNRYNQ